MTDAAALPPADDDADAQAAMSWVQRHAAQPPEGHWDELRNRLAQAATPGLVGPPPAAAWEAWIRHTERLDPAALNERMRQLQDQVRDNGITYNVYAHAEQAQRPWALDLFPLLIDRQQWAHIEQGVRQRMRLLEGLMHDAYGAQDLVRRGLLPAALVHGHPGYLPAMHGVQPVGGAHLSVAAFDLARGPDGLWWMLAQRTQAPSGLGYLLENRIIISRLFPQAFERWPVQRLAASYQGLIDGLKARCPREADETPHMALLTPGPYNETYFEHAYLARYLGLTLVQAEDLTVRGDRLYLKTLQGLQRVHALLKRVDDTWLDPLELRADSTLGVPGLLQAVRAGQVLVANTPGSGFLESNALLGFLPALAQDLLQEELMLPAIPSWWCGEAAAVPDALAQLPGGMVLPTYPAEGPCQSFEPVDGRQLHAQARADWAERIAQDGAAHTVQAWLPLSHQPVWQAGEGAHGQWQTRPVVLRVFALADAEGGWQVLPGGLARLGLPAGVASMQRGGSSADVWVQAESAERVARVSRLGTDVSAIDRPRAVTSRAAENLFWMGRYTERAEHALRLTRLMIEWLDGDAQTSPKLRQWLHALSQAHGLVRPQTPSPQVSLRVFQRALVAGLTDLTHCTGVGFNLQALLNASAAVRERLSPEHWQLLNHTQQTLMAQAGPLDPGLALATLRQTSLGLAAITGAQTDRMTRDDGWRLLSLGRHIERIDALCRALLLALPDGLLRESAGFDAVLALFDSTISFHAQFQQSRTPQALVHLLVSSPDNPRSIAWVAQTLRARLRRLGHLADGATNALAEQVPPAQATLQLWPPEQVGHAEDLPLRHWLLAQQAGAGVVAERLSALFFSHSQSGTSVSL